MRLLAFLLILFGLIITFGCLQRLSSGSNLYEQEYMNSFSYVALADPSQTELCKTGTCLCMVCQNGSNIFGPLQSLVGGYCYFETNCTANKTAEISLRQSPYESQLIHHFMIGQGPTFGDFSYANTFCNNRLGMAVQWLLGSNESPYLEPDASRAMCFLSKDVMPVYILYSNGTDINITQTRKIAQILGEEGDDLYMGRLSTGPVGPVVVIAEMNFDVSDAVQVAAQINAINDACGNIRAGTSSKIYCLTAIGPKINDFTALDAVMTELYANGWEDKLDLIAYGIDGRYVHSCDGTKIRQQALNFSAYALYNHSKPTIIPYVLFDPGTNDTDNSCTWTEYTVVNAYGSFFPLGIQSLQKKGVIGIAPYSFNTTGGVGIVNPLNCSNCAVGKTQDRLRAWYGGCQSYTWYARDATSSNPSGGTLLIFGNESGSVCNQNAQFDYLAGVRFTANDILQQQKSQLNDSLDKYFSCDECIINNISSPMPFAFNNKSGTPSDTYCSAFPEVDQWAGARNLDPMLVRAFIITESSFEPCAAAKVCRAGYGGSGCFDNDPSTADECYNKPAYDYMEDPTGNCTFANAPNWNSAQPDWRWCGLGLMQALAPPYTFWPAAYRSDGVEGEYNYIYELSNLGDGQLAAAKSCNPINFNPFNPSDSACLGTWVLEAKLKSAESWIASNRAKLNWAATDEEKDAVFTAYVAAHKYGGSWDSSTRLSTHPRCTASIKNGDCWALGFVESWLFNDEYCASAAGETDTEHCDGGIAIKLPPEKCYGYDDFIKYIRECEVPYLKSNRDSGANKIENFFWLTSKCENSLCPDGKKLYHDLGMSVPSSGTPYIQDPPSTP
ncbi:MAG: hypothetical protein ABH842_00210 [Candidatus Micrarchaeota archaeon]